MVPKSSRPEPSQQRQLEYITEHSNRRTSKAHRRKKQGWQLNTVGGEVQREGFLEVEVGPRRREAQQARWGKTLYFADTPTALLGWLSGPPLTIPNLGCPRETSETRPETVGEHHGV